MTLASVAGQAATSCRCSKILITAASHCLKMAARVLRLPQTQSRQITAGRMSIASRKRKLAIFDKVSLCAYLKSHDVLFSGSKVRWSAAQDPCIERRSASTEAFRQRTYLSLRAAISRERLDIDGVTVQYLPWAGRKLRQFSGSLGPIAESVQQC